MLKAVALIPARSGSKRVVHKNVRVLHGHSLIAYSIVSALQSGVFEAVICATDSEEYADIARKYGAEVPELRPHEISGDRSPDFEWVEWILDLLERSGRRFDIFSILRPTSPFRSADTIRRAWSAFSGRTDIDSIRAVELCSQHPGKMWVVESDLMQPLLPQGNTTQPWHSSQYASLPPIYVQNACLEMAWTRVVKESRTIAGHRVAPFFTEGNEGVDVNKEFDWHYAEWLISQGYAQLPVITTDEKLNLERN